MPGNNTVHFHLHDHDHHDHDHHHHGHAHVHFEGGSSANEDLVMLQYMLDHNEHHLDEFVELKLKLEDQGKNDAALLLGEAIELLEDADVKLADAVELLKGE